MDERPMGMPDEPTPDFAWPHRITEILIEGLSDLGRSVLEQLETLQQRLPRFIVQAASWSCVAYIVLVWICLCYIRYPVVPYGLWDLVEWAAAVAAVTFGAIYMYVGGTLIAALLVLLMTLAVYLTLSLWYVCFAVLDAVRKDSHWLRSYRPVLFTGLVASLALATFADGSSRFWDRPFEITRWAEFVIVTGSAWAALFVILCAKNSCRETGPGRL